PFRLGEREGVETKRHLAWDQLPGVGYGRLETVEDDVGLLVAGASQRSKRQDEAQGKRGASHRVVSRMPNAHHTLETCGHNGDSVAMGGWRDRRISTIFGWLPFVRRRSWSPAGPPASARLRRFALPNSGRASFWRHGMKRRWRGCGGRSPEWGERRWSFART